MNFKQKSTREQLLFSYRNLLYSFVLSFLFFNGYSQVDPEKGQLTPEGILENVYDRFGNQISLSDIQINSPGTPEIMRSIAISCSTTPLFNLYFEPGSGMENISIPIQDQRREILCKVFTDLSNFIISTSGSGNLKKVNIWVRSFSSLQGVPSYVAGLASSYYNYPVGSNLNGGIIDNEIWKTIHSTNDSYTNTSFPILNSETGAVATSPFYHGFVAINFNAASGWNTDIDVFDAATGLNGRNDLYSVVLHEVLHALGIASLINSNGTSLFSPSAYYSRFDRYLISNSTPLVSTTSPISMYNYAFTASQNTVHPNCGLVPPSTNSPIYSNSTNCANAVEFNAGSFSIPIYTPACYERGSSLSHFEDTCYDGHANNDYFVMSDGPVSNHAKRTIQPEERQVLCDLGYSLNSSFGSNTNHNYINYGGSTCNGIGVSGTNDGMNISTGAYIYTGNSGANITINGASVVGILANDFTTDMQYLGFEGLEDVYDSTSFFSARFGDASTLVNFRSSSPGVHLLRYVPYNVSNNQRGNITYVFVKVFNNCQIDSECSLVKNGNFEEHTFPPSGSSQVFRACGWQNASLKPTADYYNSDATHFQFSVPCNMMGNQMDKVSGNQGYVGMFVSERGGLLQNTYSESIKTELQSALLPNTNYILSFDVSLAEARSMKKIKFQALLTNSELMFNTGGIIPDTLIGTNDILLTNSTYSNSTSATSNGWETITFNFNTGNSTNLKFLYLGGLNNVSIQNESIALNNPCSISFALSTAESYYYLDNVSLVQSSNLATLNLPVTICLDAATINLNNALSISLQGVFSGDGVYLVGSNYLFNASIAGIGTHIISFTSCQGTITGTITINSCLPTCTLALVSDTFDSNNQVVCVGNPINYITYATTGNPSNVTFNGLPIGVTGSYAGNLAIIYGTPTVAGVYNYTLTTVGCATNITATGTITVVAPPTVGAITGINYLCVGSTTTFINATAGGSWSSNDPTVANVTTSGLITGFSAGTATISYTIIGTNGCSDAIITKAITINNCQTIDGINDTINISCTQTAQTTTSVVNNDTLNNVLITSSTPNIVVTLVGAGVSGIILNPNGTLSIPAGLPNGTYTLQYQVCSGTTCDTATVSIIVNQVPTVNNPGNMSVCKGAQVSIPFTGCATSYSWTATTNSIGLAASGTGTITFTAINTTSSIKTVTVTVTPKIGAIAGSSVSFIISVPPTVKQFYTVCENTVINKINPTNGDIVINPATFIPNSATYNWIIVNPENTSLLPSQTSGTGAIPQFTVNATQYDSTTFSYWTKIVVTPIVNGYNCTASEFKITIKPVPVWNPEPVNKVFCNNIPTGNIVFSSTPAITASNYSWTNDNPSIGLAASGVGHIISFIPTVNPNTPNQENVAHITVNGNKDGCAITPKTFTITVLPTAEIINKDFFMDNNNPKTFYFCNGTAVNNFFPTLVGNNSSVSFSWVVSGSAIGLNASSGIGNIPNFTATNTSTTGVTAIATITVTPKLLKPDGTYCNGTPVSFKIYVMPATNKYACYSDAVTTTNINGIIGNGFNVVSNDKFNNVLNPMIGAYGNIGSLTLNLVSITPPVGVTLPPNGITLITVNNLSLGENAGQVRVLNNVLPGTYLLRYRLCSNICSATITCSTNANGTPAYGTATITVLAPTITSTVKGNELSASGICYTTSNYTSTTSLYSGIKISGVDASPTNAVITPTFPAGSGWSLNAGGYIVAPNDALPGQYTFTYMVCPIGSTTCINLTCTFTIGSTLVAAADAATFDLNDSNPYFCPATPLVSVLDNDQVIHCGNSNTVAIAEPAVVGVGGNVTITIPPVPSTSPFRINPTTYQVEMNPNFNITNPILDSYTLYYIIYDTAFSSISATGTVTVQRRSSFCNSINELHAEMDNLVFSVDPNNNSLYLCDYGLTGDSSYIINNDYIFQNFEISIFNDVELGDNGNITLTVLPNNSCPFTINPSTGNVIANANFNTSTPIIAENEEYFINYEICEKNNPSSCSQATVIIIRYDDICYDLNSSKTTNKKTKSNIFTENLTILPNPSEGIFSIIFNSETKGNTILEVFDNLGRKIINRLVTNQKEYILNMNEYSSGSYLLKISNGTQTVYKKIIIK